MTRVRKTDRVGVLNRRLTVADFPQQGRPSPRQCEFGDACRAMGDGRIAVKPIEENDGPRGFRGTIHFPMKEQVRREKGSPM